MRSCQLHPRSDDISLDLARFLPNLDEESPVRLDPVFIMPEIDGFKWKSGRNLEKMARFYGLRVGRVSRVLEEEIRNRPIDIRFLMSRSKSDHWIGWFKVGFWRVGQVDDWFGQPYIQLRKLYLEQYHFFIKLWNFIYFVIWKSWNSQNYVDRIFFFINIIKLKFNTKDHWQSWVVIFSTHLVLKYWISRL